MNPARSHPEKGAYSMPLHSLVSPDTGQPLNSSRASGRLGYGLIILVIAVLVGTTSFSGLENHPLYSGARSRPLNVIVFPAMSTCPVTGL